jgi:hypothetical protein
VLTITAVCVFALWLPLILMYPEVFEAQFFNNVLRSTKSSVWERAIRPMDAVDYHARLLWEHAGPTQLGLMFGGLIVATFVDLRRGARGSPREANEAAPASPMRKRGNSEGAPLLTCRVRVWPGAITLIALAWSGMYLLVVFQGLHPTKGYWLYPAAFCFLCVGRVLAGIVQAVPQGNLRRASAWGLVVVLIAAMAPGSGVRAWWTYVRHGTHPDYNRTLFVEQLLKELPPEAAYIVDPGYVFDFYLAGRETTLGVNEPFYFLAEGRAYDYYVASRYGLNNNIPHALGGRRIATYGRKDNLMANYAEIYVPTKAPR